MIRGHINLQPIPTTLTDVTCEYSRLGWSRARPLFQHAIIKIIEAAGWLGTTAALHLAGHFLLRLLKEKA